MKKFIAFIITSLIIFTPVYAFAGETHLSYAPNNSSIQVNGNYQKTKDYYEITLGVPGLDSVQLPGGVTLSGSSTSSADDNKRVIIVPVTSAEEPAAYKWLTNNLPKDDKTSVPYYLGFYDADDNHIQPAGKVTFTITIQKEYKDTKLYYMNTKGQLKQLSFSKISDSAQFATKVTGYYLFLKPGTNNGGSGAVTPGSGTSTGTTTETKIDSPKTGDTSNLCLWIVLFISSCCTIIIALIFAVNKRKNSAGMN